MYQNVSTAYSASMKMSELLEKDHHLLEVLSRLGMTGSIGESRVEDLCLSHDIDPLSFVLLCNVYSFPDYTPSEDELSRADLRVVLMYLHNSHGFYVSRALPALEKQLEELIAPCQPKQKAVIRKFLADYCRELEGHFSAEEEEILPYVEKLLDVRMPCEGGIEHFDDNHESINEKLGDFKSIVMNSLPAECDDYLRMQLLRTTFELQNDFAGHARVEESLLTPMVRFIEDPAEPKSGQSSRRRDPDELSDREKEILVSVARGMLNKEIADQYSISIYTVISHRKNITRKTGIKTVAGLTVYALLNDLIDINSVE